MYMWWSYILIRDSNDYKAISESNKIIVSMFWVDNSKKKKGKAKDKNLYKKRKITFLF